MKINYVALYAITLGIFLALDGMWLGLVAKNLYASQLKGLMTDNVRWVGAGLFYALFIVGLLVFVIAPALQQQNLSFALTRGALFGLVTYATYDLTNYATLKGFPLTIVGIDLLWGTLLSTFVCSGAYSLYVRFF
ncbi:MAG TPA: DUF2177 family protein [Candidatus Saccharibacteria bacterium]|nr:DUF2177 family protein [Candidatus Saccharibacteria bacterium]